MAHPDLKPWPTLDPNDRAISSIARKQHWNCPSKRLAIPSEGHESGTGVVCTSFLRAWDLQYQSPIDPLLFSSVALHLASLFLCLFYPVIDCSSSQVRVFLFYTNHHQFRDCVWKNNVTYLQLCSCAEMVVCTTNLAPVTPAQILALSRIDRSVILPQCYSIGSYLKHHPIL